MRAHEFLDKPTPTPAQVAKNHGVSVEYINQQLKGGIKHEHEHTSDNAIAREIALDHIGEDPKYYEKLSKVEKVDEAPITDYQTIGNFEKPGPFSQVDRKLVTHPTAQQKAIKFFENTPYDFRLFFSNKPGMTKHREFGEVTPQQVQEFFPKEADTILANHGDAITVIYNGNYGDAKVMLTPWVMAHRIGHALNRDMNRGTVWEAAEKHFFLAVNRQLESVYNRTSQSRFGVTPAGMKFDLEKEYSALFNAIGTQRSSREGQIKRPYEFMYEMFAQYLGTGQIKFNPFPQSLGYGRQAWGKPTKHLIARGEDASPEDLKQASEILSNDMEYMFADVLSYAVGKIYLM